LKVYPEALVFNVYRRSWKDKVTGKVVYAKTYAIRYRFNKGEAWRSKTTGISDKQSAEQYAKKWHLQKEREAQGLAIPEAELKAATASVLPEVNGFIADLTGKRRTKAHISNVKAHLKLLGEKCGWKKINDIKAASFIAWRADQSHRAPKTLNEFLGSASAFCSWLVDLGKLPSNPMDKVKRAETRGQERRKRRVLTEDELRGLCAAAGKRALIYAFAFYTGIRRNELKNILVVQVETRGERMCVSVRAAVSKNREEARLPIHHALVPRLKQHLAERIGCERLFASIPRCDTLRADLKRAGIPYRDSEGRQADFHSLRHATSTHMGANHAAPRAQMGMMRHHDMKLTMATYTDETHIPLREAIEKLPNILDLSPNPLTHTATHGIVFSSPDVSHTVATGTSEEESQSIFMEGLRLQKPVAVATSRKGRKAAALGLETMMRN
jgi:integrase